MAATVPSTRAFYGPINPAILGFDWEEDVEGDAEEEGQGTTEGALAEDRQPYEQRQPSPQQHQQHQEQNAPRPQSLRSAVLGFWAFNAALLRDFDDDTASVASGMATDGGSIVGEEVTGVIPPTGAARTRGSISHTPPLGVGLSTLTIRGGQDVGVETGGQRARETTMRRDTNTNRKEPSRSNNPYAAAIENKQNAMTVAFLRSPTRTGPADTTPTPAPDELGFGQRYQVAKETAAVVITNQRRLPDILSGDRECIICTDTKPVSHFPTAGITKSCAHEPATCLVCVATSIRTDLSSRLWNEIKCPECRELLEYDDVQRFADDETKERYQTLSFRSAISSSENFLWCTSGCGYGQVHEGGASSPIVTCRLCAHRSCFHHKVAWHENLTCDEYDALLADPANFRSRFDMDNEEAEQAAAARQAQEDADRVFAQGLLAEEQRVVAEERAAKERAKREEREAAERAARETREREMREAAARKKLEEDASSRTVGSTTKPCPGCRSPIEKNEGCAHMTCAWCKHGFCWDCLASHKEILESDNSAHKAECPWHPNNIKD
ncbi:hypothetical protein B0I37DRAFT_415786 [Chaetomium sp. MPI-CAGE-AT-0009]|nr:hypothetical protein B0I37DRAFT_415786 [Chaetomium sp. MPI-CAGE-AT-0009]